MKYNYNMKYAILIIISLLPTRTHNSTYAMHTLTSSSKVMLQRMLHYPLRLISHYPRTVATVSIGGLIGLGYWYYKNNTRNNSTNNLSSPGPKANIIFDTNKVTINDVVLEVGDIVDYQRGSQWITYQVANINQPPYNTIGLRDKTGQIEYLYLNNTLLKTNHFQPATPEKIANFQQSNPQTSQ